MEVENGSAAPAAEQPTQKLFGAAKEIGVTIQSGGAKKCIVRWPSDEEWCERMRKQRTVRRSLGRGKSEAETVNGEQVDADLFAKIRIDHDGPIFDEAEAAKVIDRIESVRITGCEFLGDRYKIDLSVPGAKTSHLVMIPTAKDVRDHQKATFHTIDDRRLQIIKFNLEPAGALYDKVAITAEGYAGAVPIVHKSVIITELLHQIDQIADADDDGLDL